jgi:hypothetical protein
MTIKAHATAILLVAAGLSVSGCDRPQAAAPPAPAAAATNSYTAGPALQGNYVIDAPEMLDLGRVRFAWLEIRDARAFGAWAGGDRSGPPPIALVFIDETLGFDPAADGPADPGVYVKVAPVTYAVSDNRVVFTGTHPATGNVAFEGVVDPAQLAVSQQTDNGGLVVMSGSLTASGAHPNLSFTRERTDSTGEAIHG